MKIKFTLGIGFANADHEEIFEYDDNTPTKEIEDDHENWMWNYIDAAWYKVNEDGEDEE